MNPQTKAILKGNLKRELKTNPFGAGFRFTVMAGLAFMTYAIVVHNGNFALAFATLKNIVGA